MTTVTTDAQMRMPQRLIGNYALITGASSGIGRATAIRFAEEGATIGINFIGSPTEAQETLTRVREASKQNGHADSPHRMVEADVTDEAAVQEMFRTLLSEWRRLDILINNAGIQVETESAFHSLAEARRIMEVNLFGALACAQEAIRHFLSRPGGGTIVSCSSIHQKIPKPGYIGYSISKGGLANLTQTLALEYADRGIRVNAVAPGAVLTPMNASWKDDAVARARVERHIPIGRAATAEKIASVFAFLASDDASYITGQTIYACGGLTLFADFRNNWST